MKKVAANCFALVLCYVSITAQNKKDINAIRISTIINIDGELNENSWEMDQEASSFIMLQPDNGIKEPKSHGTVVKVLYDDNAIYIGVKLYDNNPDSILREFSQRDNIEVEADIFTIAINPFNDGINETT